MLYPMLWHILYPASDIIVFASSLTQPPIQVMLVLFRIHLAIASAEWPEVPDWVIENACPCMVMIPVREDAAELGATVYRTAPGPVPLAVVSVSQPVTLLVAVHAQPSGGVTAIEPEPPALTNNLLDA